MHNYGPRPNAEYFNIKPGETFETANHCMNLLIFVSEKKRKDRKRLQITFFVFA